jgi:hypothetical protein
VRRKARPSFFEAYGTTSSNSKAKRAAKASAAARTKTNSAQSQEPRAIALPELREELKNQVGNDVPKIVTGLIDAAAKGSCGHAKYLFEMIGGLPEDPILETVKSEGTSQDANKSAEESKSESVSTATDAVE